MLSHIIPIATGTDNQQSPDVLYSPSANRYLVAWQQPGPVAEAALDVYGRLYQPNGTSDGSSYLLSAQPGDESYPRLALSLSGDALLLWQWQHNINDTGIYGVQMDTNGQPYGDVFPVIDPQNNQERVALAYNGSSSHLVTWQDNQVMGWNTYAALFQPWQETVIIYSYDPLYRLTEADYDGTLNANYQYEYDAVGNMIVLTETVNSQTTITSRLFNPANQLISADSSGPLDTTFAYDANGNLIQQDTPATFETLWYAYDQRNRLVAAGSMSLGEIYTDTVIAYDGASNRLRLIEGGTTTTYTNDILGLSQVLVADDGTTQIYNVFGLDLLSQDDNNEARTLLTDGLGSVRVEMVDDTIETITTYEPFGNLLDRVGTHETSYGFTGEQEDTTTGLLYLRARYYNLALNSFITKDPWKGNVGNPASFNGYMYGYNNPLRYVDPSGFCGRDWGPGAEARTQQCIQLAESLEATYGVVIYWPNRSNLPASVPNNIECFCVTPGDCSSDTYNSQYKEWTRNELLALSMAMLMYEAEIGRNATSTVLQNVMFIRADRQPGSVSRSGEYYAGGVSGFEQPTIMMYDPSISSYNFWLFPWDYAWTGIHEIAHHLDTFGTVMLVETEFRRQVWGGDNVMFNPGTGPTEYARELQFVDSGTGGFIDVSLGEDLAETVTVYLWDRHAGDWTAPNMLGGNVSLLGSGREHNALDQSRDNFVEDWFRRLKEQYP